MRSGGVRPAQSLAPSSANFPFFFSFGWTGGVKLPLFRRLCLFGRGPTLMVPKQWRQKSLGRRQKSLVCREMYSFPQACSWHTLDGRTVDGVHKGKGPRPVDPDAGAGAFEPTESSSQTTASLIFSAVLCCVCACIPSPPCSLCCRRALYAAC